MTVAESRQPRSLFETGLPPRYYMPFTDVKLDLLTPSQSETQCPQKGTAMYWDLQVGDKTSPASRASTRRRSKLDPDAELQQRAKTEFS